MTNKAPFLPYNQRDKRREGRNDYDLYVSIAQSNKTCMYFLVISYTLIFVAIDYQNLLTFLLNVFGLHNVIYFL